MENAWQAFSAVAALVGVWTLLIFGVLKAMLAKSGKDLDEKIEKVLSGILDQDKKTLELEKSILRLQAEQDKKTLELEKSILRLQADLPLNYVRKEDFIRHEVVINTKLDRLRDLMEGMKEDWRIKYGRS